MTVIPLTKWAFFVEAATTREVLDTLKKSDLREGSKYDKRYPGIIRGITNFFEQYIDQDNPAKKYWREIVVMLKKDNLYKAKIDTLEEEIWKAKSSGNEEELGKLQADLDEYKAKYGPEIEKSSKLGFMYSDTPNSIEEIIPLAHPVEHFLRGFNLYDTYRIPIDFSSYEAFVRSVRVGLDKIEEREYYRELKESVSPDSWDSKPIYEFDGGWAIWPIETDKDVKLEGEIADHCFKDDNEPHCYNIVDQNTSAFSLRDKNAVPWATLEMSWDRENVFQVQGRHNQPVLPEHQKMIAKWLAETTESGENHPYMTEKPEGERFDVYPAYDTDYPANDDHDDYVGEEETWSWEIEDPEREVVVRPGFFGEIRSISEFLAFSEKAIDLVRGYASPEWIHRNSFKEYLQGYKIMGSDPVDPVKIYEECKIDVTPSLAEELNSNVSEGNLPSYEDLVSIAFNFAVADFMSPIGMPVYYVIRDLDTSNPLLALLVKWIGNTYEGIKAKKIATSKSDIPDYYNMDEGEYNSLVGEI